MNRHTVDYWYKALLSLSSLMIVLALWQTASSLAIVNPVFLPSPYTVAETLLSELVKGDLYDHIYSSIFRLSTGWSLGVLAGFVTGLAINQFMFVRSTLSPWVTALFAVPKIALLPLFILWLGTGETARIAVIILGTGLPTAIYTWHSMDHVSRDWLELGRSLHLSRLLFIRKIILPAALPGILTGLKLSASLGIILLTAAEMLGASKGIGFYIMSAGSLALTENVLAGIVILMILASIFSMLLTIVERRLLKWHK